MATSLNIAARTSPPISVRSEQSPHFPTPTPSGETSMRRVVTGHDARGRAVVVSDGSPPRTHNSTGWPGFVSSLGWSTEASVPASQTGEDPTDKVTTMIPGPGSTRLILLTLPPD